MYAQAFMSRCDVDEQFHMDMGTKLMQNTKYLAKIS